MQRHIYDPFCSRKHPARTAGPFVATFVILLVWSPNFAEAQGIATCAQGQAPSAIAPDATFNRMVAQAARAMKTTVSVGISAAIQQPCVTAKGVFVPADWLAPGMYDGPPARSTALAAVVYLAGVRIYNHQDGLRGQSADLAAARFTGCGMARLGVKGDDLAARASQLSDLIFEGQASPAWRSAFLGGYQTCQ